MDLRTFDGNLNIYHRFLEASKFAYGAKMHLADMDFSTKSLNDAKDMISKVEKSYIKV
jgi:hypothetical protein